MRITHLELLAVDLDEIERFYGSVLELPLSRDPDFVIVTIGWSTIVFRAGNARQGAIHIAFTIPRNQFAEAKEWLAARVQILSSGGTDELVLDREPWHSKSLYFRGPDGIDLELIARQHLPIDSSEQFSSASLLCVSEVGRALPDVPVEVERLRREFGIEPFGDWVDEFAPVGDQEGLFILVNEGRVWFPTTDALAFGEPREIWITNEKGGPERRVPSLHNS
jgi:catechol 2,3-dioxygenase-like lactoylglutathione lyase family enzyme